jgi:hypothetical protein
MYRSIPTARKGANAAIPVPYAARNIAGIARNAVAGQAQLVENDHKAAL